ncbi:hypothetical protein JMJ35_000519 [Cladonia borealis]|uniref:Heterokaryon incompatibility domain-containing protein n=1 Tax=Cladonia borealis TaxID=184061 RepID=A0AA39V7Y6_9LECA|nr:hypothetical protein JMJ35_000519 [Cladonia borealis]
MAATSPVSGSVSLLIDDEQDLGIREVFRSVEHEIARDHTACSGCLGVRKFLEPERCAPPKDCYRLILPELIQNSGTCWFCRFLCRVMARFLDEEQFENCQIQKIPIYIHHARGLWEEDLMITASPDSPASSHLLALSCKGSESLLSFMPNQRLDPNAYYPKDPLFHRYIYKHLRSGRIGVFITVDNQKDRKVRKLCKLISDSVQQRETYFGMIRKLLALCEGRHELCMGSVTEQPPFPTDFTLIDTLNRVLVPYTDSKPYIALSYVWGKSCLERYWNDDGELTRLGELTIEDAICVTRRISQRYLWVDLLCINQIEPESRNNSISKMDAIFSRALLTICVLQSQSMFSGIPGVSQTHQGRHQILTETESLRYMAFNLTELGSSIYLSDWSQRGWTFQEGVLSARRLCFDTSGVFLHCKEEILHDIVESFDTEQRIKTPFNDDQYQSLSLWISPEARAYDFTIYARMVMSYSPRALTLPADAHNAIAGVLSRMTRSMNMSFIGGMPESDFFNALLWDDVWKEGRRPQFPSWSWLGWKGPIRYDFWVFDRIKERTDNSKLTEEVNEIHSIRTRYAIYFDTVRIQSAARFTFTNTTRDGSHATLRIKTQKALFQVLKSGPSEARGVCWRVAQSNGDLIPSEADFICRKNFALEDDEEHATVFVPHEVSNQLSHSQSPQLEFVLLQQWTYNETSLAPQILDRDEFLDGKGDYRIPKTNPPFIDHVWLMAVAPREDGMFERLDVINMPARFWNEANAEPVSIDVV